MTAAQENLVTGNINLVYYFAAKLGQSEFVRRNKDDITSEGMVGLVKAAKAFDPSRGLKFATFAATCINNEMLMYIRRNKKREADLSLHSVIGSDIEGRELLLADILTAEESNIERAERAAFAELDLEDLTQLLNLREKQVLESLKKEMKQRETATELNVSQSYVSRVVQKIRKKYKHMLDKAERGYG